MTNEGGGGGGGGGGWDMPADLDGKRSRVTCRSTAGPTEEHELRLGQITSPLRFPVWEHELRLGQITSPLRLSCLEAYSEQFMAEAGTFTCSTMAFKGHLRRYTIHCLCGTGRPFFIVYLEIIFPSVLIFSDTAFDDLRVNSRQQEPSSHAGGDYGLNVKLFKK